MKNIFEIIQGTGEITGIPILRPVDLEALKDILMGLEVFKDTVVFNVVYDSSEVKTTLMDPKVDKFNSVVDIYSININPSSTNKGEYVLMVNCKDGTVIRGEQ